jgi:hypothetical protein
MLENFNLYKTDPATNELIPIDLIDYLYNQNYFISFAYENIFKFFPEDVNSTKKTYYSNYKSEWINFKIKFLSDSLLYESVKAPFCISFKPKNHVMTKGNQKKIAFALNHLEYAPIMFVDVNQHGLMITNYEDLYMILKSFDPTADKFNIEIDSNTSFPALHYIENSNTVRNWSVFDSGYENLMANSKLPANASVALLGNLTHDDSLKNIISDKKINKCHFRHDIFRIAEDYQECDHVLYSEKPYVITKQYLEFVQCNLYHKQLVKAGVTPNSDLIVYNKNNIEGMYSLISYPFL